MFENVNHPDRPVFWIANSKKELMQLPREAINEFGNALTVAQYGSMHSKAKPMKGFGSRVIQVTVPHRGNTFRLIYTTNKKSSIYVLTAFMKKSKSGSKTDPLIIDRIRTRLHLAQQHLESTQ